MCKLDAVCVCLLRTFIQYGWATECKLSTISVIVSHHFILYRVISFCSGLSVPDCFTLYHIIVFRNRPYRLLFYLLVTHFCIVSDMSKISVQTDHKVSSCQIISLYCIVWYRTQELKQKAFLTDFFFFLFRPYCIFPGHVSALWLIHILYRAFSCQTVLNFPAPCNKYCTLLIVKHFTMGQCRALHDFTIYSTKGIILPCYYLECVDVCVVVVVAVRCFCTSDHYCMAQKLISQRTDNSTDKTSSPLHRVCRKTGSPGWTCFWSNRLRRRLDTSITSSM